MALKGAHEAFNNAGSSAVKQVDSKHIVEGSKGLPMTGAEPNSVTQKIKDGKVSSERYYDEKGNAYLDIDYSNHGNTKTHPVVPHQHRISFIKGKPHRGKAEEVK